MTSRVLAHIEALGMSINWEKSLIHATLQTTFNRRVSGLSVDAGPSNCGTGGEASRPTTACPPLGAGLTVPDVAQAAGDAVSGLSSHIIRPAASTPTCTRG